MLKTKIFPVVIFRPTPSPIPALTLDKTGAAHKGYQWVYHDPVNKLVMYDYQKSRGREGPDELLKTSADIYKPMATQHTTTL